MFMRNKENTNSHNHCLLMEYLENCATSPCSATVLNTLENGILIATFAMAEGSSYGQMALAMMVSGEMTELMDKGD